MYRQRIFRETARTGVAPLVQDQRYKLQKHASGVFNILFDLHQELHSFSSIKKAMIVGQCEVHHGPDDDLTVYDDWLVLDSVETKNSGLRKVDNWSAHERTKNTSVRDGKGSTSHVLNSELIVTSLAIESAEE